MGERTENVIADSEADPQSQDSEMLKHGGQSNVQDDTNPLPQSLPRGREVKIRSSLFTYLLQNKLLSNVFCLYVYKAAWLKHCCVPIIPAQPSNLLRFQVSGLQKYDEGYAEK